MKNIKITLPLYYTIEYKTKQNKTILINNNWYRNTHYQIANKVKHYYKKLVLDQIDKNIKFNQVKLHCNLYYKSSVSDLDNYSILIKFLLDPLQEIGCLENDNVNFVKKITLEVKNRDINEPRLEITIKEIYDN